MPVQVFRSCTAALASVLIQDLDDFLAPAQACIKPLVSSSTSTLHKQHQKNNLHNNSKESDKGRAKVTLGDQLSADSYEVTATDEPDLIRAQGPGVAKVSLNDCLACSGCVTSAESVLINQQSGDRLLSTLSSCDHVRALVLALSPQTLASLAAYYDIEQIKLPIALREAFTQLARRYRPQDPALPVYLYSTVGASYIALQEAAREFIERYGQQSELRGPDDMGASTHKVMHIGSSPQNQPDWPSALPMLVSACPGWVCYAEKTTPAVLPYLSPIKSPQQILGTLVKDHCAPGSGLKPREVYLVGLMPCYDKKLEASRKDFFHEDWDAPEVDLVLSTIEVAELLRQQHQELHRERRGTVPGMHPPAGADPRPYDKEYLDQLLTVAEKETKSGSWEDLQSTHLTLQSAQRLFSGLSEDRKRLVGPVPGSVGGSGGFVEYVFRAAARELFEEEVLGPLKYEAGRNADLQEVVLKKDGEVLLRFALAYGFRNIQSIVNRLRRRRGPQLHFVEVMACPAGCVNGGGQLRDPTGVQKEMLGKVKSVFAQRGVALQEDACISQVYRSLGSEEYARQQFKTQFHAVPKLEKEVSAAFRW